MTHVKLLLRAREEFHRPYPAALAPVDRPSKGPLLGVPAETLRMDPLWKAVTAKTSLQDQEHHEDFRKWPEK